MAYHLKKKSVIQCYSSRSPREHGLLRDCAKGVSDALGIGHVTVRSEREDGQDKRHSRLLGPDSEFEDGGIVITYIMKG